MAHNCPTNRHRGRPRVVEDDRYLTCPPCWRLVPGRLKADVYREYAGGAGVMPSGLPSPALAEAQRAAIDAINAAEGGPVSQRRPM
jgi:hypothetical protein